MFKKFNWGWGILLVIVAFVLLNVVLIYISINNKSDLVTKDYYEKELVYQDEINERNNGAVLKLEMGINNSIYRIKNNNESLNSKLTGSVYFYRANVTDQDFHFDFKPDSTGLQFFDLKNKAKGQWRVTARLSDGTKKYVVEKKLMLH